MHDSPDVAAATAATLAASAARVPPAAAPSLHSVPTAAAEARAREDGGPILVRGVGARP